MSELQVVINKAFEELAEAEQCATAGLVMLKEALTQKEAHRVEACRQLDEVKAERDYLQAEVEALRLEVTSFERNLNNMRAGRDETGEYWKKACAELDEVKAERDRLLASVVDTAELAQELDAVKAERDDLKRRVFNVLGEPIDYRLSPSDLHNHLHNVVRGLQNERDALKAEVSSLQRAMGTVALKQEDVNWKARAEMFEATVKRLDAENTAMKTTNRMLNEENTALSTSALVEAVREAVVLMAEAQRVTVSPIVPLAVNLKRLAKGLTSDYKLVIEEVIALRQKAASSTFPQAAIVEAAVELVKAWTQGDTGAPPTSAASTMEWTIKDLEIRRKQTIQGLVLLKAVLDYKPELEPVPFGSQRATEWKPDPAKFGGSAEREALKALLHRTGDPAGNTVDVGCPTKATPRPNPLPVGYAPGVGGLRVGMEFKDNTGYFEVKKIEGTCALVEGADHMDNPVEAARLVSVLEQSFLTKPFKYEETP
jgi:predicted  nucleic acid-binding Zn-ribbon protein